MSGPLWPPTPVTPSHTPQHGATQQRSETWRNMEAFSGHMCDEGVRATTGSKCGPVIKGWQRIDRTHSIQQHTRTAQSNAPACAHVHYVQHVLSLAMSSP